MFTLKGLQLDVNVRLAAQKPPQCPNTAQYFPACSRGSIPLHQPEDQQITRQEFDGAGTLKTWHPQNYSAFGS